MNTYSITMSITFVILRSVSFSASYFLSNTYIISSYNNIGTYIYSQTNYQGYFPYIIYILSPSYVSTYVVLDLKKIIITKEQLIGISCGSVSVIFLILGIIILSIRKKNSKDIYEGFPIWLLSDFKEENSEHLEEEEKLFIELNEKDDDSTKSDIDFWL